jgi:hypothetical protein
MLDMPSEVRLCREQHGAQFIPLVHGAPRQRTHRRGSVAGHGEVPIQVDIRSQAHRSTTLLFGQLAAGVGERGGRRHGDGMQAGHRAASAVGSRQAIQPAVRMGAVGPSSRQRGGDAVGPSSRKCGCDAVGPSSRQGGSADESSRAIEPAEQMRGSRAIEPAVRYRRCGRSYNQ